MCNRGQRPGRSPAHGVEGEDRDDDEGPADGYDMVRHVSEKDVMLLKPASKEPAEDFTPMMTKELKDAVHWLWLATAVGRARLTDTARC